jgi:adenosylmethionine-8-amino-7-oxononanoate aminotransferase
MLADRVYELCLSKGVVIRPLGNIVVISPPLIMTKDQINEMIRVLSISISEAVSELA